MIIDIFFDPFINYGFMRRAIVACCVLAISTTPIGVFLILRRMSLIGDALSHAILPGIAVGYFYGASFIAMSIGGFVSSLIVAMLSNWISTKTSLHKDASISGLYLGFLALGIILISLQGSDVNLFNLLFGSILSVSVYTLKFIGIISTVVVCSIALFYRALIIETFDSEFLQRNNSIESSRVIQTFFSLILILNLIASFQVTGTLMAVGLMMLPGLSACCWVKNVINILLLSLCIAILCSWIGLIIAFHISLPAGPSIILCASVFFIISIFFGGKEGVLFSVYCKK